MITNHPATPETQVKESWDVFVTFGDQRARERATEMCDFITQQYWPDLEFELQWCDFGNLSKPEYSEKAIRAAAEARIIIVAASAGTPLPNPARAWLAGLCGNRRREGVLIGLVGGDPESEERMAIDHQLRHAAHQAGLDYLTHAPDCRSLQMPDETGWVEAKAGNLGSVLGGILATPMRPPVLSPGTS